jgi:hypothetical protein
LQAETARGRTDPASAAPKTANAVFRATDAGSVPPSAVSARKPGTASGINKYIKIVAMMKTNQKNYKIHQIYQILHHTQMNKVLQE